MANTFTVKEIFYTLQGEGFHAGRAAVFCRFSGCNLWNGREEDRASAVCDFCDTDFIGSNPDGGKFKTALELAQKIDAAWPQPDATQSEADASQHDTYKFVVLTGGEPMLQVTQELIDLLHQKGFEIAIETNGTIAVLPTIDWICVSPKGISTILQTHGHELKLVYPQLNAMPNQFEHLDFKHRFIQPLDNPSRRNNIEMAIAYCMKHPKWKLSTQMHKHNGIR